MSEIWKNIFKLVVIWILLLLYVELVGFQAALIFALTIIIWRVLELK